MKLLATVFSSWCLDFLKGSKWQDANVSKRCQFWYTFIRNWSFLYSKHSWFCYLQCVSPHLILTFDRWDLSYPEIQTMRWSCIWPLLLWPGRTCTSAPAVSLQCVRAQQAPPKGRVQLLNIVPKPTLGNICASVYIWAMTHSQIFISALWQICLTWPDMSQQCTTAARKANWILGCICRDGIGRDRKDVMWYDNPILHSACWATPGMQCPVQETHGQTGEGSKEGHKGDQRAGETVLWDRKRSVIFSPWRREGWGAPHHSIPVFEEWL